MKSVSSEEPPGYAAADSLSAAALLEQGRHLEAAAEAEIRLVDTPDSAWLWTGLALARVGAGDLVAGAQAAVRALELDPGSADAQRAHLEACEGLRRRYRAALTDLANPVDEGARLEAAFHAVCDADDAGVLEPGARGVTLALFLRLAAVEEADRRWPFASIGRELAARGEPRNLLYQIPRIRSDADRQELLAQHRDWGLAAEGRAAARPIKPGHRGPRALRRVGILSSDLRRNVVTAFAEPLIEHAADSGVEVFCYSAHPGAPDAVQIHLAGRVAAYRHLPGAAARDIATVIAQDSPDALIEIGGPTNFNRVDALASRLAPVQVSWLGYPHSTGLSTIDYLMLDPYLAPKDPSLILERALLMPHSWIALSPGFFRDNPRPAAELPQDRKGVITFGTASSPYKYSADTLRAWARVVAATPESRFLIVRPEGDSSTFRRNIEEHFAREDVAADRIDFAPVRGGHLPYYNEMDISLDTLPLTGGTTTCEALWMGVPVITLAGPSIYERMSHSILHNVGLADLSVGSVDAYVARAAELAEDRESRRRWRADCRTRIMASALGDPAQFARDFYRVLAGVL